VRAEMGSVSLPPITTLEPSGWRLSVVPKIVRAGAPGKRVCEPAPAPMM
jgi:hypothetical protein